jgi:predicted dehydrogenase
MLDIAWHLLGHPTPTSAYGLTHHRFSNLLAGERKSDVDDAAFALIRFEGGKSLELGTSWAINQPPQQNGTVCRVYGSEGAIEVYTPRGALLYRQFDAKGQAKEVELKPPKILHHVALMRHFRECIAGKATPSPGVTEGVTLMKMIDAIYKSGESGKSVSI